MAAFAVVSTNHTSFTVSDLDRTISFFRDALGFRLLNRSHRDPGFTERVVGVPGAAIEVAYVEAPGHRVELIQYHAPEGRKRYTPRPCDVGFAHIAFDVDDLDAALAAAAGHGVMPLGAPVVVPAGPNKGTRAVYTRDSDGVTIELIEKRR